ncbi:MAG: HAMP domain-containing sensor histidine kinase [Myxococcota bacterium]
MPQNTSSSVDPALPAEPHSYERSAGSVAGVPDGRGPNYLLLVQLRAVTAACQGLAALGVELFLAMEIPLFWIFLVVALSGLSNLPIVYLRRRGRVLRPRELGALLTGDVVALSVVLYLSGGPVNPLSALYLVYIALSALLLGRYWTWFLTFVATVAYRILFESPKPESSLAQPESSLVHHVAHGVHQEFSAHLDGMWVAFAVSAGLMAFFLSRLSVERLQRERDLVSAKQRAERMASLTTLSAGAAHELGSPLSTMAVASKELERSLRSAKADPGWIEDAVLIREEVARCREILDGMSLRSGGLVGETPKWCSVSELLDEIAAALPTQLVDRLTVRSEAGMFLLVPQLGFLRVLRNLIENAFDASDQHAPVQLAVALEGAECVVELVDRGAGMTQDVQTRAMEPFFTTKPQGRGIGLGLFLARTLLELLGGSLRLSSEVGSGTTVCLRLPRSRVRTET